ncbi:MAG: protein kinase [Lentisphaerae bacterium]|nr:protein kinase [Lentisphaerota bacterium]
MKLVFVSGSETGRRYDVDGEITIGRDNSNDIVLKDPSVSLVHCLVFSEEGKGFVKDLGSTNGIRINGERVISANVRDGDSLTVGKNTIRFELPSKALDTVGASALPTIKDRDEEPIEISETKPEELSGNIFGSVTYYLKRKIASGGMGAIYEAEQFGAEGFIKTVAIKTILPSFAKKDSFVSSFVGEAKLVANLVHQNIVQIHHLGRHDDGYFIAMEYIDGINLTDFLVKHRRLREDIPEDIATFIISRICRGLEYAHGKKDREDNSLGLVHRDVSPNNIMITTEGEVKLTDFGVAKAAQFMEDDSDYLVGSVEYMSPEQAECLQVDLRSDLFSLGLVYYELLTGIRVFQCRDNDIDETVERVIRAEIPDPTDYRSGLSESVKEILMKCLSRSPEDRFQSAGELGHALEREMYSKGYGPTIVSLAQYIKHVWEH